MGVQLTKVLVLAALVLGVSASSGTAATPAHPPMLGVVPHAGAAPAPGAPGSFGAIGAAPKGGPLFLQESPCELSSQPLPCWVMRTNTVHAIYWMPSGSTCDTLSCSAYQSGINQYFTDVAHDSGGSSNVYSAATQYYDATGPISYASTFAGSYVDTNPFPASGCNDGVDPRCLTDQQIENEIQNVLTAKGWHGNTTTMFFVMTPDGVGSCFDGFSNQCTTNYYCAYHSGFTNSNDEPVIYGNEPFDGTISGCSGATGQGSPNNVDVDSELNTISHEHNEAITDPWGDAWLAADGEENGDLCAWDFGPPLGTTGGQPYNQVINGHDYSLQQEYSNDGTTCVQHYLGIPVNLGAPTISGSAGQGHTLSASPGIWTQSPTSYAYQWQLCAADGNGCGNIAGATSATYPLTTADVGHTLRVAVSAHNATGDSTYTTSAPTAAVVALPASTAQPVLSGVAAVGKKLSTTSGTWNSPVVIAFQWLRCGADGTGCAAVPGATASTYVLAAADGGHTLEARISATNAAGTAATLSNRSKIVVAIPSAEKPPHISGHAKVGKKLSGSHGSWTNAPTGFRFQWLRCNAHGGACGLVGRATHSTYRLTSHDKGHRLRLRVTATNAAGSRLATSAPTGRVGR